MVTQTVTRALSRLSLDQRGTDPHPRQSAPMLLQKAYAMFPPRLDAHASTTQARARRRVQTREISRTFLCVAGKGTRR
jgi:hypothetical protein